MYTAQPHGVLLWQTFTKPVSVAGRCNNQNITTLNEYLFVEFASRGQINKTLFHNIRNKTK